IGRRERQMDEASHLFQLFLLDEMERVEAFDLGGDGAGETCGVEKSDPFHAVLAGEDVLPGLFAGVAHRADDPHSCDHYSTSLHWVPLVEGLPDRMRSQAKSSAR